MHDVGIPGVHRDLAHGTNDAQKTMGIITLTLITAGALPADAGPPFWVILSSGLAIALGTYTGGWRIIQTLGKRVSDIQTPQGFAAETSRATASAVRTREDLRVVIGRVATRFELGQPVREPAPISGGLSNELWRLDTDHGTFAIKRMVVNANLPTFVENIETAFRIEQRAWAAGVPMPEPIAEPSSGHALARVSRLVRS